MNPQTILLVENDPVIAVLTRLQLEDLGYSVLQAKEGEEAIQVSSMKRPQVVFMDFQLDGPMDGAEAASEIIKNFNIPVIFLTGRSDPETVSKCLAVKPSGYLRKPCKAAELQEAIEKAMFQSELAKERKPLEHPLHDPLTGLPNKYLMLQTIDKNLHAGFSNFAVLYIDIHRFRRINDSMGSRSGDEFLCHFAARISGMLRTGDMAARIGSDEFAILLNDINDEADALEQADSIHLSLSKPFTIKEQKLFASVSIGIVHAASGYCISERLLDDAESAMHQAKERGTGVSAAFSEEIFSRTVDSFHFTNELQRAMTTGELTVYYQPIIDLDAYRITGFEALLRWNHPRTGLIAAAEIIPVAEQAGLILPIGRWVMREACEQLAKWHKIDPQLSMHVNLSARHLMQDNLVVEIERILKETGIPPHTLKIEITENFVIDYTEPVLERLQQLRSLNVGLQIDDFGKGYSSLSYLHQFPVDALKIDRSFIELSGKQDAACEIVDMIVDLGRKLRLEVIAEGVETDAQLQRIVAAGCDRVQGFLFSEPLDASAASQLLEDSELDDYPPFAA